MDAEYEIVERLIRNISHEIKNPLTTIKGYAQLLGMKSGDLEFIEKTRKMVVDNVDQIDNRINALYELFEIQRGVPARTDIPGLLESFRGTLEGGLAGKVSLRVLPGAGEAIIDAALLEKALGIIIRGFDWENNPGVDITLTAARDGERDGTAITLRFNGISFYGYSRNTFYLPFADRRHFRRGTELFEVFCIAKKNGWDFDLAGEGDGAGFVLAVR
jgi:light-regulated signal transduction histidine kinase (bacteriophytochrome)